MTKNPIPEYFKVDSEVSEMAAIRRIESFQSVAADLYRSVASQKQVAEAHHHLRDLVLSSHKQRSQKIIYGIVLELKYWNLTASNNDWFVQILQNKGKGTGRECHGVCSMNDDESVIIVIFIFNLFRKKDMIVHAHIT